MVWKEKRTKAEAWYTYIPRTIVRGRNGGIKKKADSEPGLCKTKQINIIKQTKKQNWQAVSPSSSNSKPFLLWFNRVLVCLLLLSSLSLPTIPIHLRRFHFSLLWVCLNPFPSSLLRFRHDAFVFPRSNIVQCTLEVTLGTLKTGIRLIFVRL